MTAPGPSIVLIGGPPGAGKTTLARALAQRLGAQQQTFDHVVSGIRAVTTPETHPAFHAGRVGHVDYFTKSSPDDLVGDALRLAEATWPAIDRICALARTEQAALVMDWWLLPAQKVAALGSSVDALWLEIDPDALEGRERANDWFFSGSDEPDRMFGNFMARSLWANGHYANEAQQAGFPVIHQPGDRPTSDLVDEAITLLADRQELR